MHGDAYFTIGKSHSKCDDYAIVEGEGDSLRAVLCDGCSSSLHSDVGARILAHLSVKATEDTTPLNTMIFLAEKTTTILKLPQESLDATLGSLFLTHRKTLKATLVGDGVLVAKLKDRTLYGKKISYPSGAPYYPSYELSFKRQSQYTEKFGPSRPIFMTFDTKGPIEEKEETKSFTSLDLDANILSCMAIISDGVFSFEGVDWLEIVKELMDFKITTGSFVQRRMKRVLKNYALKGIHPYDDISMIAFCTEDVCANSS